MGPGLVATMRTLSTGCVALAMAVAAALAGCAGQAQNTDEVVVESQSPIETASSDNAAVDLNPVDSGRGHIAGLVVDDMYRPLEGAVVRIPGLDLEDASDREGAFSFFNLRVGPYFLTVNMTGHDPAKVTIDVESDKIKPVKFILREIPPPEPFTITQAFDGFADVTDDEVLGFGFFCGGCSNTVYIGGTGFRAVIIEAVMDPYGGVTGGTVGSNGFYYTLGETSCCPTYDAGQYGNPMRAEVRPDQVPGIDQSEMALQLDARPTSFPTPETNKAFEVFVTSWHYVDPPAGWSYVNGDPAPGPPSPPSPPSSAPRMAYQG
jgi:hypothetical protein